MCFQTGKQHVRLFIMLAQCIYRCFCFQLEDEFVDGYIQFSLLPVSLQYLCFTSCEVALGSFLNFSDKFVNLQTLIFSGCPSITSKHLKSFGKLDKLER